MKPFKTNKPILSVGDVCPDIILPYGETQQVLAAIARGEKISAEQESARIMAGEALGILLTASRRLAEIPGSPARWVMTISVASCGKSSKKLALIPAI